MKTSRKMEMSQLKWLCFFSTLASLSTSVQGNTECSDMTGQEGMMRIDSQGLSTLWFRPTGGVPWEELSLEFGEEPDYGPFELHYELQINKQKGTYLRATLIDSELGKRDALFDIPRIPLEYVTEDFWTSFSVGENEARLSFKKNSQEGFELRVWGVQMKHISVIKLGGDIIARTECVVDTTTTTTTTITTTEATTTTASPTTTDPPTTTPMEDNMTTYDYEARNTSEYPVILESSESAEQEWLCIGGAPLWAWICACLLVAMVILLLILGVYMILLSRQNRKLKSRQSSTLRNRLASTPSTGLGVQANEVEFYQVRNPNLMVAPGTMLESENRTTPRLFAGRQQAAYSPAMLNVPGQSASSTPRLSAYRRSMSQPATMEHNLNDPPSFEFPGPPATPPPGSLDCEDEDYVNAETLMLDDARRYENRPIPKSIDSLLKELQYE